VRAIPAISLPVTSHTDTRSFERPRGAVSADSTFLDVLPLRPAFGADVVAYRLVRLPVEVGVVFDIDWRENLQIIFRHSTHPRSSTGTTPVEGLPTRVRRLALQKTVDQASVLLAILWDIARESSHFVASSRHPESEMYGAQCLSLKSPRAGAQAARFFLTRLWA